MQEIKEWIGDNLHSIIGYSQKNIIDFIYSLAKDSKNLNLFLNDLQSIDINIEDQKVISFANDLYNQLHPSKKTTNYSQREKELMEINKKNESYGLVSMEESSSSKKPKHLRKKQKNDKEEDEEDKYEKDRKERDEFSQRLKEKDEQNKNKRSKDTRFEEKKKRRIDEMENLEEIERNRLKEKSRRNYLDGRVKKQIEILEEVAKEEEKMFKDERLTEKEKKKIELTKKILKLGKKNEQLLHEKTDDQYNFPDLYENEKGYIDKQKRDNLLKPSYAQEGRNIDEQKKWEESHIHQNESAYGSRDKREQINANNLEKYSFVFDENIDFIAEEKLGGEKF
jgi:pre-mRNA-splicing factor ATP-dependent RNA helicase DHX16